MTRHILTSRASLSAPRSSTSSHHFPPNSQKSKQNEARLAQRPAPLQMNRAKGDHGDHEGVLASIRGHTVSTEQPTSSVLSIAHYLAAIAGAKPSRRAMLQWSSEEGQPCVAVPSCLGSGLSLECVDCVAVFRARDRPAQPTGLAVRRGSVRSRMCCRSVMSVNHLRGW